MKGFFSWSIRTHLLLLVLLATLPALAIVAYRGFELREFAIDNAKADALRMEQSLAFQQLRAVENAHQLLTTLAHLPEVQRFDKTACNKLLHLLLRQNPCYANILIATHHGMLFASAKDTKPFTITDRKYFQQVLKTRQFAIGGYSLSRTTQKPVMQFAYPVLEERTGHLMAVAVASYDLSCLGRIFFQANLPQGSVLALTDPNGMRVYRFPEPAKYSGQHDIPEMISKMSGKTTEGTFLGSGIDGVHRLYGYQRVYLHENLPPFFIRVGIPSSKAIEKVQTFLLQNFCYLCLAASLAMIVAWFFGDLFIVSRLNKLVDASLKLGRGELHARTGLSPLEGELGRLAGNFDDMAEALEKREAARQMFKDSLLNQLEIQKAFLLSIPALVYVKNRDYEYLLGNSAFAHFVGSPAGDIVGKTDYDLFPEDMANIFRKTDREVMENDIPRLNIEMQINHPEGGNLWVSTNKAPFHDAQGNVVGIVGISLDITERKNAENALKESEKRLNLVLEGSNDGFWDWNMVTNQVQRNARWNEMLGYSPEEIESDVRDWKRLVHPEDLPAVKEVFRDHLAGKISQYRVECRILCKSGEWKWIVDRGKVVEWDESGKPLRMAGTATDITERKQAEHEKQQLSAQLRQAQKLEAIGQLTGGIAHDFNNILTAIIGYGHLLLMNTVKEDKTRGFVEQILMSADRAAGLTQSLLAFSRKQIINPQPVDLNEIIKKIEKLLRRLIGEDIQLHTAFYEEPLIVMADCGQIEQILMNLATNARDAMPDGGTLSIRTDMVAVDKGVLNPVLFGSPVKYACMAVSDSGTGMDEVTRERIFEPFFTTKEVGQGTGLGLSIVHGIVEQHKGYVNVQSEIGNGTTFKVYFPACISEVDKEDASFISIDSMRGTETILLAEDENDVRATTKNMLERYGYSVVEAHDGENAVNCFMENKERIQLLILDMIMPKRNGRDVYDSIRGNNPEIKALFISGYTADILDKKQMLKGEINYLKKPFSPSELLKRIREILDN